MANKTKVDCRTVDSVIMYVKQYRDNYHKYNSTGKNATLQDAAKSIPVPKRTLDNYFIQLKIAYLTGFDFSEPHKKDMKDIRRFTSQFKHL